MIPWVGLSEIAFLYRTEQGRIDRATWVRGVIPLVALLASSTVLWRFLAPFAARSPGERAFFDPLAIVANVFLIFYALGVILLAVSWVNLTAKRLRDRGRPQPIGLASLFPLVALCAGALHWLLARIPDFPRALVFAGDAVSIAVLLWTIVECADLMAARRE